MYNLVQEMKIFTVLLCRNLFIFTLPYRYVWSSIVTVHEKKQFFASFFRNNSKTAETILIKKIGRNHGISVYNKALKVNIEKMIFFEIITGLSKCLLVSQLVCTLPIVVDELAQKLVLISKPILTRSFGPLRLRADQILVHIDPKLRWGGRG